MKIDPKVLLLLGGLLQNFPTASAADQGRGRGPLGVDPPAPMPLFVDSTAAAGIHFEHHDSVTHIMADTNVPSRDRFVSCGEQMCLKELDKVVTALDAAARFGLDAQKDQSPRVES